MGTIPPTELLDQWRIEALTVEMAIGHILQNQVRLYESVEHLTHTLHKLRVDVDRLTRQISIPSDFDNDLSDSQ